MSALVVGLRVTGLALVDHFARHGVPVVAVDDGSDDPTFAERAARAREQGAQVVIGPDEGRLAALVAASGLVVPSPGVPPEHPVYRLALEAGVPVRSEIDVAAEVADAAGRPVVAAVTGTNGKTTVTTVAVEMLRAAGVHVLGAGNLGPPLVTAVADPDVDVVVAEVSSFQLEFTTVFRPAVAAWLNLAEDHLDWHPTFDAYADAKSRIFKRQRSDDVLVFNADDPVVTARAAEAPGRTIPFTLRADAPRGAYRVRDGLLVTADDAEVISVDELPARLPHDLANALAAMAVAGELGAPIAAARGMLRQFTRLPHRVQLVGEANGVRFYDDSKATNPHAAASAVRSFEHVVLIAGGLNKGLDLGVLRAEMSHLRAVVAIGDAADDVERAFAGVVPVTRAAVMAEAVGSAAAFAEPGDAVLLSPACASFDWYGSYGERGDDFAREVRRLLGAAA